MAYSNRIPRIEKTLVALGRNIRYAPPVIIKIGADKIKWAKEIIERERANRRRLLADRREVVAAPIPSAIRKAPIPAYVAHRAGMAHALSNEISISLPRTDDSWAVACALQPKDVIKYLYDFIDADSSDDIALTDAERKKRLNEIEARLLASARPEEYGLGILLAAGDESIVPREDSDVRAIIGLADDVTVPASAIANVPAERTERMKRVDVEKVRA